MKHISFTHKSLASFFILFLTLLFAFVFIFWLSVESKVEKINRINAVIDSHMMYGQASEAYQFLRSELDNGAPLMPNWLYLLKYETDLDIKLTIYLDAIRSNPDQEHTYQAISTTLMDTSDITKAQNISTFLKSLSNIRGINQNFLQKYQLSP